MPNNPLAIARGIKQAKGYVSQLRSIFPDTIWEIVIDTY